MPKPLWAPWRLEYVQQADEAHGLHLLRARRGARAAPRRAAFALLNRFPYASGHLMVAPCGTSATSATLTDDEALEIHRLASAGLEALARGLRAAGPQPRLEPRPRRGRRDRRPRAPPRRPALGRRHELHAGARRRARAARGAGRIGAPAPRGLAARLRPADGSPVTSSQHRRLSWSRCLSLCALRSSSSIAVALIAPAAYGLATLQTATSRRRRPRDSTAARSSTASSAASATR